jgi:ketosteroid isomerase-like protein
MADIREKLVGLCDAFNAHDLDRIMSFFADNCVLEMPKGPAPWGTRYQGKPAVRKGLASRLERMPDVNYGNDEHFVDEVRQTGMSKWTLTGTTRDRRRNEVRGCDFYTFRDGMVTRKDSYWKIVDGG